MGKGSLFWFTARLGKGLSAGAPAEIAIPQGEPDLPGESLSAVELDWERIRQLLDELEPPLAMDDMRANSLLGRKGDLIRAAFGPAGEALIQRVAQFLYPEALELLRQLRDT